MHTARTFLKGAAIFWYVGVVCMGVGDGLMIVLGHLMARMGLPDQERDAAAGEIPFFDFGVVSVLLILAGGCAAVFADKDAKR